MLSRLKSDLYHSPQLWIYRAGENVSADSSPFPVSWLSASEQQRFSTLTTAHGKTRFLHSRLLIRQALSYNFCLPLNHWEVDAVADAPPQVKNADFDLNLSLSHSHEWIVLALGRERFGVDIEKIKPRKLGEAAPLFMSGPELDRFLSAPTIEAFYRTWCLKEACYKAFPDRQKTLSLHQLDTLRIINEPCSLVELSNNDFLILFYLARRVNAVSCFLLGSQNNMWHKQITAKTPAIEFFNVDEDRVSLSF